MPSSPPAPARPLARLRTRLAAAATLLATAACASTPRAPAQSPGAATPLVIGESFTMPARAIGGELRRINVWRPSRWDGTRDTVPLPVLYMPDGGMQEDFLHIAGLLQVSIGNGTMRPFILVGIENTERRRDLTGPTRVARDSTIAPRVGGSAAFRAFLRDELMPEVARLYRVTNERAIVGESLAGLFVVETFLLEPRLFDAYLAFDPSLWWNAGALVHESGARLRARPAGSQWLWIATSRDGDDELARALVDSIHAAKPEGLTLVNEAMPEERHATIYHPAALRAFRVVFAPADSVKR